jgi:hypothetical protein
MRSLRVTVVTSQKIPRLLTARCVSIRPSPGGYCPAGHIVNPGSVLERALSEESIPVSGTFGLLELPACRFKVYRACDGRRVRLGTVKR